jgi:hypothetical protein
MLTGHYGETSPIYIDQSGIFFIIMIQDALRPHLSSSRIL